MPPRSNNVNVNVLTTEMESRLLSWHLVFSVIFAMFSTFTTRKTVPSKHCRTVRLLRSTMPTARCKGLIARSAKYLGTTRMTVMMSRHSEPFCTYLLTYPSTPRFMDPENFQIPEVFVSLFYCSCCSCFSMIIEITIAMTGPKILTFR